MDSGLACNSRIQRLLWTQDYITLTEEVILLESSFVLNRRNNLQTRMVQVGLTSSTLLIAEEKLSSASPANKCIQRQTKDCNSDIELFELIYLFPLANVRLSVRTHSEVIGEHVIRVRLCNGLMWYLELSDVRHREDKWHEWVWWVHELEQRRKLESKRNRKKQRMKSFRSHSLRNSEHGSLGSPVNSESILESGAATINGGPGKKMESPDQLKDVKSASNRAGGGIAGQKQSTAHRWVHHFAEHLFDHHDETLANSDDEDNDPISHDKLSHRLSSQMWSESHLSVGRSPRINRHSKAILNTRMQSVILQSGGVDSLSSLEDIESVGSLVSSNAESWTNRHAKDTRKGLILSIADLFEKTNVEAHAHGHVGRTRPMASMTRLDVLLEDEVSHIQDQTRKPCINKCEIHHTSSLPDVLEGEASFIEDLPNADSVTHRTSLVYLDLENDDDSRTAHVINGHVMLLTKDEMKLYKLVDDLRKTNPDPRLKQQYTKKDMPLKIVDHTVDEKKKRRWSIARSFRKDPHHDKSTRRVSKPRGKRMSIFFTGANRKQDILRESPLETHIFDSMRDVLPEELANELTVIDAELFLRIHEAEMVGCMWLKEDRNYRAPNVVSAIDFFKKVAGMVTTEVLLPSRSSERTSVIIYFLRVAVALRERKNFHSLRAVLAGLQSPAVYRLRDAWMLLDEQNPKEYQLWQDLLHYTDDEGLPLENDPDLDQAMRAPPCLPFLGSVLMRIIEFYSTVDINGTRLAHKLHDHDHKKEDESSNGSEFESTINIVEGHALEGGSEKDQVALKKEHNKLSGNPKSEPKLYSFFKQLAHKVDSLGSKQSRDISVNEKDGKRIPEERKQHIRLLILEYAQLVAEERERINTPDHPPLIDTTLCGKLLEDFEGGNDVGDGDVDHTRSRHYRDLRNMAHEHDDMPWKHQWTSEFHLHEALLQFQLSAVQYEPREKNHAVRELLLKEYHHSDEENFKISLEREPPEKFYSIHNLQEQIEE